MLRSLPIVITALFTAMVVPSTTLAAETRAYFTSDPSFFTWGNPTHVYVDGKEHKMAAFEMGYEIAEAMKSNPIAYEWAKKHEAYSTASSIALWGGYAAALAILISSPRDRESVDTTLSAYWTVFGVGLFTAIGCKQAADAYLYRAINAFNGVNDGTAPPQTNLGIDILPTRDGASLALQLEF